MHTTPAYRVFLVAGLALGASVQAALGQSSRPVLTSTESAMIERVRKGSPERRLEALQEILRLEPDRARQVLPGVVEAADDDYAAMAARALISTYADGGSIPVIGNGLARRSNRFRAVVLETCVSEAPVNICAPLAKSFLNDLVVPGQQSFDRDTCEIIGLACLTLARSSGDDVGKTLGQACRSCLESRRVWLALTASGGAREDLLPKAQSIYRDSSLSPLVRVAAATAAAPIDSQAEAFVLSEMGGFVSRFGDEDPVLQSQARASQPEVRQKYAQFREEIKTMGSLRFLMTASAQETAVKYATVENSTVRDIALITICLRWPELFFKEYMKFKVEADRVARFLAVISVYHGERGKAMIKEAHLSVPDDVLSRMRQGGLTGTFGLAGSVVLGL